MDAIVTGVAVLVVLAYVLHLASRDERDRFDEFERSRLLRDGVTGTKPGSGTALRSSSPRPAHPRGEARCWNTGPANPRRL